MRSWAEVLKSGKLLVEDVVCNKNTVLFKAYEEKFGSSFVARNKDYRRSVIHNPTKRFFFFVFKAFYQRSKNKYVTFSSTTEYIIISKLAEFFSINWSIQELNDYYNPYENSKPTTKPTTKTIKLPRKSRADTHIRAGKFFAKNSPDFVLLKDEVGLTNAETSVLRTWINRYSTDNEVVNLSKVYPRGGFASVISREAFYGLLPKIEKRYKTTRKRQPVQLYDICRKIDTVFKKKGGTQ